MGTSRRSALRFLPPFALLLAGAVPLACFKPAIVDGGLKCNMTAGAKACPDGYVCDHADGRCTRHPTDAGKDVSGDVLTDVPASEVGDLLSEDGPACFQPVAGCTSGAGTCDPTCQTGCACRQKCSVSTNGTLTCNAPQMQGFPRGLMQSCTYESLGSNQQTDNCGPGLVCVDDECFPRCYKFCQTDNDCTTASCTRDIGGGQKVCDVPFVDTCVPLMGGQNTGCTGNTMSCYLSSTTPMHTICDCPQGASGPNGPCTKSRECNRGLACVDRGNGGTPTCLQVCRLNVDGGTDCNNGQVCHPYLGIPPGPPANANANFGYCL